MKAHLVLTEQQARDEELRDALQVLAQEEIHIQLHATHDPEDRHQTLERLLDQPLDTLAVAGGDGSLHHTVQQLMQRPEDQRPALGLIPMGTANDFATAARIPTQEKLPALRMAFLAPAHPVDVIQANDKYVTNMCTAGAGTQATTDADDKLKDALGGLAYLVTGLSKLPELEARPIEVQTPDFAWSGQIWNASIGNGRQAGGGWCLCPLAQIDDGLLDLMLLPRLSETRWGRILKKSGDGAKGMWENLPHARATQASIRTLDGRTMQFNLDGEPLEATHVDFRVCPGAIAMRLPATTSLTRLL